MTSNIFDRFNLNIDESWKLGLIGRNGRGKTTFLNLLLGKFSYHGEIQSSVNFKYFPQKVVNPTQLTRDVLMQLAGVGEESFWQVEIEMDKLKIAEKVLDQPFDTLSPGERTKALLAVMFIDENAFQLIDEPTNHLDIDGRAMVANYLQGKQGFIVVSHDRAFIDQIIDHVLSIDRAKVQLFNGNFATWQKQYDRQNAAELEKQSQIKADVKKLTASANRVKQWADHAEGKKNAKNYRGQKNMDLDKGFLSHKAAKIMNRNHSTLNQIDDAIDEKQGLLRNIDKMPDLSLNYVKPHQEHLLAVDQLQVARNQRKLNQPFSFDLKRGDRLVLEGANGLGKTTILKAILGQANLIESGRINLNQVIRISYLTQNFAGLSGQIEDYAFGYRIELSSIINMLRKLGFERAAFKEDIANMSMGQKRKVALARSLCEQANLYIWDEPLNYLDVITRQQIQDLILRIQPTMLIIDHDLDFIKAVQTNVVELTRAK
ncbi:ABC-F family ATP-binding cassette domain-containing protein [Lactobacillus sp. Sy-1]|nr:ATP-binding cassette domain-containing protein [Lactobacillus sp. Sy-1]MBW1604941.1 ABC-F family ATP-binding cassette domain-containing protein [Lactobacillus sp. Sy-1]